MNLSGKNKTGKRGYKRKEASERENTVYVKRGK
jgi:hypothetical protein